MRRYGALDKRLGTKRVADFHQCLAQKVLASPLRLVRDIRMVLAEPHAPDHIVGTSFDKLRRCPREQQRA
jgi:hypothetical protein